MILIYSDTITPRMRYIFRFVFEERLGIDTAFTDSREKALMWDGPVCNYSREIVPKATTFVPSGLLHQAGLKDVRIEMAEWEGLPVFFHDGGKGAWPFDPFGMIFYLLSRYEEYLPFDPDAHGRFPCESSLACRHGFLEIPVVDILCNKLAAEVMKTFPHTFLRKNHFNFTPTFDIDIAFAHTARGFFRALLGTLRLFLKGKFGELKERNAVVSGTLPDPYDNFDFQQRTTKRAGLDSAYFVLAGNYGRYDRNNSFRSRKFIKLLKSLSNDNMLGLHPSYASYGNERRMKVEKRRLERIIGKEVTHSRQHFLRLSLPETYRGLSGIGITDDHSMGYSTRIGFRAGTSSSFWFYDLLKEEETNLRVHPFGFMDSALADQMGLSPGDALVRVKKMIDVVAANGAELEGIWHNYALSGSKGYEGWDGFFEKVVDYASNKVHDQVY